MSILVNILFHAPMGRFQLELIYYFTYFSTVVPSNSCVFLSYSPFFVNTTFSTVNYPSQETEETSTPTRPVENIVLTTKGLQERNTTVRWDDSGKTGKIINEF